MRNINFPREIIYKKEIWGPKQLYINYFLYCLKSIQHAFIWKSGCSETLLYGSRKNYG